MYKEKFINKWYGSTEANIVGIPLDKVPPAWKSSSWLPEKQLEDLGSRGPFVGEFKDYNYDQEFAKLVAGKRVAFVCPSPHLRGQKMGAKIDSYDLVVRVNQHYHMTESDWEDYGFRTDILMNCLNIHKIDALRGNMNFPRSLKYIVCPMVSMWDIQRVENFLDEIGTPWHNVCDGYLFKIFKEVGTTCNSGLTSILTLLNYDIKELYVTGMTFFNMNTFGKVYYNKYHDEASKNGNFTYTPNRSPSKEDLRMDLHQQPPQIEYFKKVVQTHYGSKLSLDNYLMENFKKSVEIAKRKNLND